MNMKIINNTDINNLILFAKKNLGIYRLVYIEQKKAYFLSIAAVFISLSLLIAYILTTISHKYIFLERLFSFSCLFICFSTLGLLKYIETKTKYRHLKIQDVRFKLLKDYYNEYNYNSQDIKIINQQLEKRIEKIEKQKITILVVIGVMILPIWDIYVQQYFDEFSAEKITGFASFFIVFSFIILIIVRFLNKALYLYEENFYIKNNVAVIENLIYLNRYIIQEKTAQNNNRFCNPWKSILRNGGRIDRQYADLGGTKGCTEPMYGDKKV